MTGLPRQSLASSLPREDGEHRLCEPQRGNPRRRPWIACLPAGRPRHSVATSLLDYRPPPLIKITPTSNPNQSVTLQLTTLSILGAYTKDTLT